jgi:hypothetical protein
LQILLHHPFFSSFRVQAETMERKGPCQGEERRVIVQ